MQGVHCKLVDGSEDVDRDKETTEYFYVEDSAVPCMHMQHLVQVWDERFRKLFWFGTRTKNQKLWRYLDRFAKKWIEFEEIVENSKKLGKIWIKFEKAATNSENFGYQWLNITEK